MRVELGQQDGLLRVRHAVERAPRAGSKQGGGWVNAELLVISSLQWSWEKKEKFWNILLEEKHEFYWFFLYLLFIIRTNNIIINNARMYG